MRRRTGPREPDRTGAHLDGGLDMVGMGAQPRGGPQPGLSRGSGQSLGARSARCPCWDVVQSSVSSGSDSTLPPSSGSSALREQSALRVSEMQLKVGLPGAYLCWGPGGKNCPGGAWSSLLSRAKPRWGPLAEGQQRDIFSDGIYFLSWKAPSGLGAVSGF